LREGRLSLGVIALAFNLNVGHAGAVNGYARRLNSDLRPNAVDGRWQLGSKTMAQTQGIRCTLPAEMACPSTESSPCRLSLLSHLCQICKHSAGGQEHSLCRPPNETFLKHRHRSVLSSAINPTGLHESRGDSTTFPRRQRQSSRTSRQRMLAGSHSLLCHSCMSPMMEIIGVRMHAQ
jgi:hypothetical protein